MSSLGLINWSGHWNLGDDAMARVLTDYFPEAVNFGDKVVGKDLDWYIMGGGTLIANGSAFMAPGDINYHPENTIGISLGVASGWDGRNADVLKRFRKIYVRDKFSKMRLADYGVESTLSVDLLCFMTSKKFKREGKAVNLVFPRNDEGHVGENFALSRDEDIDTVWDARLFTNPQTLLDWLATKEFVFASRLHALVLAWVAGCEVEHTGNYDQKVFDFMERVDGMKPKQAKKIIDTHLKEIKDIIYE